MVALSALLLAGCVDYGQMQADMNAGIESFKGRNIEAAIGRLGLPSSTQPLGADTIYVWTNGNVFVTGAANETPLRCDLRLRARADGTILGGDYDGNRGACVALRDRLAG